MTAVLIACAHGTRFEEGRVVVRALLKVLRETAPEGVEVHEAYVDVHGPYVTDVVAAARERTDDIVIVPLLLSTGYHTEVDLVEAAGGLPIARALGPHPVLAEILADRVRATGADESDTVVLAAAGSTRPGAVVDVERMAELMTDAGVAGPIVTAYAAASEPRIPDAVNAARSAGRRTVAASYVLAPGHFSRVIEKADADLTSEPIGADPRLAEVVWERWREARGGTAAASTAGVADAGGRAEGAEPVEASGRAAAEGAEPVEASGRESAPVPSTSSGTSAAEGAEPVVASGRESAPVPSTSSGTSRRAHLAKRIARVTGRVVLGTFLAALATIVVLAAAGLSEDRGVRRRRRA
ncbi:sirohydrochlorin chelatase [Microbacterium sp. VKM Ac-2923]|uniref:sirohydrochlorin chelatase n=1 Tax=Microbacterium sp. VKM Ac-2923 TaxID=2929476 RepID=UPI001FB33E45|nr:sirohydrochlorin chelatase [Microbacterium sp. VKM Ac-2923]MCJ1706563.1 sirohydrochlorin chelatase [Microbacterium sp. VKM Ac-2923]